MTLMQHPRKISLSRWAELRVKGCQSIKTRHEQQEIIAHLRWFADRYMRRTSIPRDILSGLARNHQYACIKHSSSSTGLASTTTRSLSTLDLTLQCLRRLGMTSCSSFSLVIPLQQVVWEEDVCGCLFKRALKGFDLVLVIVDVRPQWMLYKTSGLWATSVRYGPKCLTLSHINIKGSISMFRWWNVWWNCTQGSWVLPWKRERHAWLGVMVVGYTGATLNRYPRSTFCVAMNFTAVFSWIGDRSLCSFHICDSLAAPLISEGKVIVGLPLRHHFPEWDPK